MTRSKNKIKKKPMDQNSKPEAERDENQCISGKIQNMEMESENTRREKHGRERREGSDRHQDTGDNRDAPSTLNSSLTCAVEEEETVLDRLVELGQGTGKLWLILALLAAILAILAHLEVADEELLIVEKGVALPKTRASVFQFVGDLRNYNRWYPGIRAFDATDATPMGTGKHFTEVIDIPIIGSLQYDNAVIGYESPWYVCFVTDSTWLLRTEIELSRRDSSKAPTLLQYRVYSRSRSYLFKYFISHVLSVMYSGRIRQALFNLRFIFME